MPTHIDHLLYRVSTEGSATSHWVAASLPIVLEQEWCELPVPDLGAVRDAVEQVAIALGREVRAERVARALGRALNPAWGRTLVGIEGIQLVETRGHTAALLARFGLVRGPTSPHPVLARVSSEGAVWTLDASVIAMPPGVAIARHASGFAIGAAIPRRVLLPRERLVIAREPAGEVAYDATRDELASAIGLRRASYEPYDASVERDERGTFVVVTFALPDGSLTARIGPFNDPQSVAVELLAGDDPDALGRMPGLALTPRGLALLPPDTHADAESLELIAPGSARAASNVVDTARRPIGLRHRVLLASLVALAITTTLALARGI